MMGYVEEPKRVLERKARGSVGFGGSAIASPTSSHWLWTGLDSKAWIETYELQSASQRTARSNFNRLRHRNTNTFHQILSKKLVR